MRRRIEALRRRFTRFQRLFGLALALLVMASMVLALVLTLDMVTVVDGDGSRRVLLTASHDPHEILDMAGLSVAPGDKVEFVQGGEDGPSVQITRAFPVHLVADGSTLYAELAEGTVGDLLALHGVELDEDDFVQPAADTPLYRGLRAVVKRVSYEQVQGEEILDEAAVAAFAAGTRTRSADAEPFEFSLDGSYLVTRNQRFVDGQLAESEIVGLVPLKTAHDPPTPRPADSYELIPGVPCSRIAGFDDIEMDENGLPVNYTRLWSGAVTTAYSSSGGRGASGLGLYCGTVAVNPNVIPYGTRMFITSADGSFVYGFAIATDTGLAMMEGYVDIDIYFETNAECLQFGKRPMEVYILD